MRKNKLLAMLMALSLIISLCTVSTSTASAESAVWNGSSVAPTVGDGTAENPFLIETAENLSWYRDRVNSGAAYLADCAKLTNDIVLNDVSNVANWATTPPANCWTMIVADRVSIYQGTLDGNGHTVSGIYCDGSTGNYTGLIARTGTASVIKNLGIINSYFKGISYVGSFAGESYGNISSCYSNATVISESGQSKSLGGIAGNAREGTISDCYFSGKCKGGSYMGGIAGQLLGAKTIDSYSSGTIIASGIMCGSLAGRSDPGCMSNCYYLEGTATDGKGMVQNGKGSATSGTATADKDGVAAAVTAEQISNGYLCCELQGTRSNLVWTQYINHDAAPQLWSSYIYDKVVYDGTDYVNYAPERTGVYYQLGTPEELLWYAKRLNSGEEFHAQLCSDIDMSGVEWTPIAALKNTFDGQGYSIKRLNQNANLGSGARKGFINIITTDGTCKNVVFDNASVWDVVTSGIIANTNRGIITKCLVTNSVIELGNVVGMGGLVGINNATISICGVINSTLQRRYGGASSKNIGGIAESNTGTIRNCYTYNCNFSNGSTRSPITVSNSGTLSDNCFYTASAYQTANGTPFAKKSFTDGEAAYYLNHYNSSSAVSSYFSQGESYPVLADSTHKAAYRITLTGEDTLYCYTDSSGRIIDLVDMNYTYNGASLTADTVFSSNATAAFTYKSWLDFADTSWYNSTSSVFSISTPAQLAGLAKLTQDGTNFYEKTINLTDDIILNSDILSDNGDSLNPVGKIKWIPGGAFCGTLNGNGHTIYGMFIRDAAEFYEGSLGTDITTAGMFRKISSAQFKNIALEDFYIVPNASEKTVYAGSFAGLAGGSGKTFENCYAEGYVRGTADYTGSLVGMLKYFGGSCNNVLIYCKAYGGKALFGKKDSSTQTVTNTYFYGYYAQDFGTNATAAELLEPSFAYRLNTEAGTSENSGMWSHNGTHPILTANRNKAVYKVALGAQVSYLQGTYTFPSDAENVVRYVVAGDDRVYNEGESIVLNKDINITASATPNEFAIVSATVAAATIEAPSDISATLIFAAYRGRELIATDVQKNIQITRGCNTYYPTAGFSAENASKVTVMLWESTENIKPLCSFSDADI